MKKLGRGIAAALLRFSLFMFALAIAFMAVFGSPETLKRTIEKSGIYNSFVDNVIRETQKQKTAEGIPLERPEVQAAAKAAFTPEFLRTSSESIIDSTYDWLNKKTAIPEFRIDLSGPKQAFIDSLGNYAVERAKVLPVCTLQQLREADGTIDPFDMTCVPSVLNPESLRKQVAAEINSQEEFIQDTVVTADNFSKNAQGESPFEQASHLPDVFGQAKIAPLLLLLLAAVSAGGLLFLHDDRRRGVRNLGMTLLSTGIVLFVFSGLLSYLFGMANRPDGGIGKTVTSDFQATALSAIGSLGGKFGQIMMATGGAYIIAGAIIWFVLKRVGPTAEEPSGDKPAAHNPPAPPQQPSSPPGAL